MTTLSPELALVDEVLGAAARAELPSHPDVFAALDRQRGADRMRQLRAELVRDETEPAAAPAAPGSRLRRSTTARLLGTACLAAAVAWAGFALAGGDGSASRDVATPHAGAGLRPRDAARPHAAPKRTPGVASAAAQEPQKHAQMSTHKPAAAVGAALAQLPPNSPPKPAAPKATKPVPAKANPPVTHSAHRAASPIRGPRTLSWAARRKVTYYRVQVFRAAHKPVFLFEVWTAQPRVQLPATWVNAGKKQRLGPGAYRWVVYPVFGKNGGVGTGSVGAKPIADGAFSL